MAVSAGVSIEAVEAVEAGTPAGDSGDTGDAKVTCVVRCLAGEVSPGTVFDTVTSPGGDTAPVALRVAAVWRYGREAALLDPPHVAKLDLAGEGVRALRTGGRLTAQGE